jgi:general secretion pathway protein K
MKAQKGAALLMAMLTVALVATLASAALWQQWRQVEIEIAERGRSQTAWMMTGALDWTRLILREDANSAQAAGVDHLGEPWALPVQESRLSSFLSQDQQWREGDPNVFLSGHITDAQSRLNVRNLVEDGRIVAIEWASWRRLFERLSLPLSELDALSRQLVLALPPSAHAQRPANLAPLMPQRTAQLVWMGLSPATLNALAPFVTVLPESTTVNLNTAPPEVLMASVSGLDLASARQLITQRARAPWTSLEDARKAFGSAARSIDDKRHSIQSQYFEVNGRMRIDQVVQQEQALVRRENKQVRMLWRSRAPLLSHKPTLQ